MKFVSPRRSAAAAFAATVLGLCVMNPATADPLDGPADDPARGGIANADSPAAIPGSYLVLLKPGTPAGRIDQLAASYDGTVTKRYPSVGGFAVTMSADRATALAEDPTVASVEANMRVTTAAAQVNPPSWGLDRIDQAAPPRDNSYTQPVSAAGVTVYVIDTGMRITHEDFGGRAVNGWDFIDNDPVAQDGVGHGTHVAGTIGGAEYGVAKDVNLVAVRVLDDSGSGTVDLDIAGIQWVIENATLPAVINMSLSGSTSALENAAVKAATDAGIVVVAAAGNQARDACTRSPASAPEAITVGASTMTDEIASFSNWGGCVDVFAPGEGITSASNGSDLAFDTKNGTSMAAPHVAAAAALLLAADPTATPAQVQHDLVAAATPSTVTGLPACTTGRLLTVGLPAGAPGTDVPPAATGELVTLGVATPGSPLPVYGNGFGDGETVEYTMYPGGESLGEDTASADGEVSSILTLPAGITCDVTVVATGMDELGVERVLTARVMIVVPVPDAPEPPVAPVAPVMPAPVPVLTLPLTGAEPIGLAAGGAGLVLAGIAVVLVAGRRRRVA